jgi:hypothetical protein
MHFGYKTHEYICESKLQHVRARVDTAFVLPHVICTLAGRHLQVHFSHTIYSDIEGLKHAAIILVQYEKIRWIVFCIN